jgi:hypothetical protein
VAVQAGRAELPVVPTLVKNFSRDLVNQMAGPAQRAATTTGRDAGRQFGRTFERAGDDGARRFGVRFNKRLGSGFSASTKIASVAAGAIGGAFAAVQIGGFLKGAIDEAREAAKVGRQTAAVIKATGGVAKVSARDVDKLADRLSALVGVDDEIIATGANMLLTFKGVRNEVGKGNNIFDRASVAALDMTAAMGKGVITQEGLQGSTIRLGKALNDPIKGMTALTRVGVTFTDAQKKQITALVEAGDKMGAQKIILDELASEFGGAAKAAADPWQKVGVAFDNVKEDIGTVLLPALQSAAGFITDKLIPGVKGFAEKHGPAFREMFSRIHHMASTFFKGLRDNLEPQLARIRIAWDENRDSLLQLVGAFKTGADASSAGADSAKTFGDAMVGVLEGAGKAARFLDQLGDVLNTTNEIFQTTGADIHNKFIVPVIADMSALVLKALKGNRQIIAGAATVAEALHLPMAAGLRKAEQRMSAFIDSQQADIDSATAAARAYARRVPGGSESKFGQSLRAAERQMSGFRGSFNANIGALRGKKITIPIKGTFQPPSGKFGSLHAIVGATGGLVTPTAIVHRADGGPIRMGTGPTADDVPAMLSKGEYVINAKATRKHRGLVEAINRDGLPGFARGGQVDVDVLTPKMGRFAARIQRIIDTIGSRTAALLERRLRIFVGGVGKAAVTRFIRSVDPLPYIWGGVGPRGYDCSGLVGEVLNRHKGLPSYRRRFTTASIRAGQYGLKPGLGGVLDIGVTAGTGHMAGRYGGKRGLGFEAESTRTGIKIGAAASTPESFARKFHLAEGGPVDADGVSFAKGGYLNPGSFRYAKHLLQRIRSRARIGEDFTWRGMPRSYGRWNDHVLDRVIPLLRGGYDFPEDLREISHVLGSLIHRSAYRHRHRLAEGGPVVAQKLDALARAGLLDVGGDPGKLRINGQTFDRGGTLSPGLNLLANRTGRPEPLVPAGQGGITVNVTVNGAVGSPREIARVLAPTIRQEIKEAQRRSGVPAREQVR